MKKIVLYIVLSGLVLSFSGCKFIASLLGGKSFKYENVSKTEFYEIKKSDVNNGKYKIPCNVSSNQNVFVIQVNTSDENIPSSGKLNNEISEEDFMYSNSSRSAELEENLPLINEVPSFVRNFKGVKKIPAPYYSITNARYGSNPDIGNDEIEFNIPGSNGHSIEETEFFKYEAELKYTSKYAYVYYIPLINYLYEAEDYEGMENYLSQKDFKTIGDTFDSIYKAETALLGSNKFSTQYSNLISSSSEKITILLCDIYLDSKEKQNSGTFGYFSQSDFITNEYLNETFGLTDDASNETEIIYIDSVLYKNYPETSLSTLTHEFCHLLNYCNKEMKDYGDQETWFTEMLAMITEEIMYTNYVKKDAFDSSKIAKVRIPDYCSNSKIGFTEWSDKNTYANYGNTFAYGSFLIRNYGGIDLLHQIATNKGVNAQAIEYALTKCGQNTTFKETVREFAIHSMNAKTVKNPVGTKTLNKSVTGTINGYDFNGWPIDISNYGGMNILKNKSVTNLGSTGFIVQYAGKGENTLNVTLPEYEGVSMYCVIQTVE